MFALNTGFVSVKDKIEGFDLKELYVATQIESHAALLELMD